MVLTGVCPDRLDTQRHHVYRFYFSLCCPTAANPRLELSINSLVIKNLVCYLRLAFSAPFFEGAVSKSLQGDEDGERNERLMGSGRRKEKGADIHEQGKNGGIDEMEAGFLRKREGQGDEGPLLHKLLLS